MRRTSRKMKSIIRGLQAALTWWKGSGLSQSALRLPRPPHIQEAGNRQDLNAVVSAQPEQVFVAGHDVIRSSRHGALQTSVIRRIFLDDVQLHRGSDDPSGITNDQLRLCDLFGSRVEFAGEHVGHFIQDMLRYGQSYSAVERHAQKVIWLSAPIHQAGYQNVRVRR